MDAMAGWYLTGFLLLPLCRPVVIRIYSASNSARPTYYCSISSAIAVIWIIKLRIVSKGNEYTHSTTYIYVYIGCIIHKHISWYTLDTTTTPIHAGLAWAAWQQRAGEYIESLVKKRGVRELRDSFSRGSLVGKNGQRVWKIGKNLGKFGEILKFGKVWKIWKISENLGKIRKIIKHTEISDFDV